VSLAFLSRNRLVVASNDGAIVVRELDSDSIDERFDHQGRLVAFAMAPNEKLAASWSEMGDVTIWDTQTWTVQRVLSPGRQDPVSSDHRLSFSPDSAHLAIARHFLNSYPNCQVWDARTGDQIHGFRGHAGAVEAVQFSPDESLLASASLDCTVRLWDLNMPESSSVSTSFIRVALSPTDLSSPLAPWKGLSKLGRRKRTN